jgi:SpoVK/Ycf46/Vps4 family AAA+-type ATPase
MYKTRYVSSKPSQIFISERFNQVVVLHVLKNNLRKTDVQVPLLLGIHGPTGEGKTFQCEHILKKMGVKRFLISGGQLDNPVAGQPAELIRKTYLKAGESIRGGEVSLAVMLVNDVDTGLGSWGDTARFTTNQQTVFGELMHLVDYPTSVENKETLRIPIVITGNDFTKLYEPLVRAGRMTAFEWIPNIDERVEIVSSIFKELTKDEIRQLILDLNEQLAGELPDPARYLSIAYYSHLRSTLLDEDLWAEVQKDSLEHTIDNIIIGKEPDFTIGVHYERVLRKGLELARSGQLISHLKHPDGVATNFR